MPKLMVDNETLMVFLNLVECLAEEYTNEATVADVRADNPDLGSTISDDEIQQLLTCAVEWRNS